MLSAGHMASNFGKHWDSVVGLERVKNHSRTLDATVDFTKVWDKVVIIDPND